MTNLPPGFRIADIETETFGCNCDDRFCPCNGSLSGEGCENNKEEENEHH